MPSKTYNKAVINGVTYIDLSEDTVEPDALLNGYTAHDRNGEAVSGALTPVTDVQTGGISVVSDGVASLPKIYISTSDPTSSDGIDGDIWLKYVEPEVEE